MQCLCWVRAVPDLFHETPLGYVSMACLECVATSAPLPHWCQLRQTCCAAPMHVRARAPCTSECACRESNPGHKHGRLV